MKQRQQNTTLYPIPFLMIDSTDHVTGKTGLSPTVTISKNGGAFTSPSGAVTELANGWYILAANATDRNTLGEFLIHVEASGADPTDDRYVIVPWDPFDAVKLGLTGVAVPGDKMDMIDAPNAAAVAAIQSGLATGTNVSDAQTAIISATSDIDDQLDNILSEISSLGIGTAPIAKEYYVYVDNLPCADVLVVMSTDALGINKIHRGYTDALGLVTFYPDLVVGTTIYMWCYKTGVDFTNPDTEVI